MIPILKQLGVNGEETDKVSNTTGCGKHSTLKSESKSRTLQPHGLHSPWNSPGQNTGVGSHSLLQGIFPTQGWNPGLPHCRQIPAKPPGKHKNTGVGSLTLLLSIFPTQESNWGLRHCRWSLYQLSYERSPLFQNLGLK